MTASSNMLPWDQQLARLLVRPFRNTKLHPNHLTTITLLLGQSAAWMFAFAMDKMAWLAALLYVFFPIIWMANWRG